MHTDCCPSQAALKVIAEMQRIPMPSPRKTGAPRTETLAGSEENAAIGGNSSSGPQQQENVHQAPVGASVQLSMRILQAHCRLATKIMDSSL